MSIVTSNEHISKRIPFKELSLNRIEQLYEENDKQLRSAIFLKSRAEKLDKEQMQQLFLLNPLRSRNMDMVRKDMYAKLLYEEERSVAEFV